MTVRILTDAQKAAVVTIYTSTLRPKNIKEMATLLQVSTRTISRVLEEAGIKPSKRAHKPQVESDVTKITRILYKHKINPDHLEAILEEPAMLPSNVSLFLKDCNQEQLYIIFTGAGLLAANPDHVIRNMAAHAILNAPAGRPIPKSAQLPLI